MRRCAFSTNNNTTGTSDLTAPSRGRLFFNVRPASAYRAAFGNPPSRAEDFIRSRPEQSRPQATNGRSAKKKRSLCLHPDLTAGGPHRPPKRSAHGDRPCRIEDLPPPIRHIVPHATETRRLPVVPARRAAFPRRRLPTYAFPAGCGGACDDARRKRIGRIPARRGTGQKKGGRVLLFRPIRSCRTTHSLGSI